jgi:hypothetical protein
VLGLFNSERCEMAVEEVLITTILVIVTYAVYPYLRELIYIKPKRRK